VTLSFDGFAPAVEIADLIRSKKISPLEFMEWSLERIQELNPRFNAIVSMDADKALEEARKQTALIASGHEIGPFGGLPFAVKDLENAAGFATTLGSRLYQDNVVDFDDVLVARLKNAGAILVGKTNTPEFGHIPFTDNDLFGPTRNPWDETRTPGGSSGGSAAALATAMLPLATASDGGGSIRIPACYSGLYGLKPSQGRVPIAPRVRHPWLSISCYGPLTRSVKDAARYLDIVAGPHDEDPTSLPANDFSYEDSLKEALPPLRIAFNETLGVTRLQADVKREFYAALKTFSDLGHEVEETKDVIPEMGGWWARVSAFQSLGLEWENYRKNHDLFTDRYAKSLDRALDVGPDDFANFLQLRGELIAWTNRLFQNYDLLLTPTLPTEAFLAEGPIPSELDGERFNAVAFTYPFNFTGHPAASVRAGFTDAGLPCGLQIVGRRFRDDIVLRASHDYEKLRPWSQDWPQL
jgi:Asp-tRNA(Asn)/Glu-tRNA(Gln) amidotransferase A subunit family amidase